MQSIYTTNYKKYIKINMNITMKICSERLIIVVEKLLSLFFMKKRSNPSTQVK